MVLIPPASKLGRIMLAGCALPAVANMPKIDVGNSCKLVQEITTNITILRLAMGEPLYILSMALMPIGVAAPFMPKRLALMFKLT